ncbi:MAG TPA: RpiB/LacA/LacB family sugar-phosphate isomerase [Candidatus Dormibacteraeota bacterium]|nr:RpiB/LacA/LacB family sugar-phosphate isomerase [Candidatus Dormibacteraeota bacterium]
MTIFIGADHAGFEFKKQLSGFLSSNGYQVIDQVDQKPDPNDDFPQFAARVINNLMASKDSETKAILICGSGQGMCMAANRFKGIRASLCWNQDEARAARNDDDSNVLCLSSRYQSLAEAQSITTTWLNTAFAGAERFRRRIKELDELN